MEPTHVNNFLNYISGKTVIVKYNLNPHVLLRLVCVTDLQPYDTEWKPICPPDIVKLQEINAIQCEEVDRELIMFKLSYENDPRSLAPYRREEFFRKNSDFKSAAECIEDLEKRRDGLATWKGFDFRNIPRGIEFSADEKNQIISMLAGEDVLFDEKAVKAAIDFVQGNEPKNGTKKKMKTIAQVWAHIIWYKRGCKTIGVKDLSEEISAQGFKKDIIFEHPIGGEKKPKSPSTIEKNWIAGIKDNENGKNRKGEPSTAAIQEYSDWLTTNIMQPITTRK